MTRTNSTSLRIITDPRQAAILTDPQRRRFALPFLGRAATVSQVAAGLGVKTSVALYWVHQMLTCGLLDAARVEARAGRAIRHYRCPGDTLFVPFEATPFTTQEALAHHAGQLFQARFERALASSRHRQVLEGVWGTFLARDDSGTITVARARWHNGEIQKPEEGLPFNVTSEIQLRPETALELSHRLRALIGEYTDQPAEFGGRTYLLRVGLT